MFLFSLYLTIAQFTLDVWKPKARVIGMALNHNKVIQFIHCVLNIKSHGRMKVII